MGKVCVKCGIEKEISEFSPHSKRSIKTKSSCKSCRAIYTNNWRDGNRDRHNEYGKKWRASNKERLSKNYKRWKEENPEKVRNYNLMYNYGITIEDYFDMAMAQEYKCAICLKLCEPSDGKFNLAVDHCHSTGVVRELLCKHCNTALGLIGDNSEIAIRMAAYLGKHGINGGSNEE